MGKYLYKLEKKKIEYYLEKYNLLDLKISKLSEYKDSYDYMSTYNNWIKNKGSNLENNAIRNIELEQRIYKTEKWQNLIAFILEHYKIKDKIKYKYICLKYFKKLTPKKIEKIINLTEEDQNSLKDEILNYILDIAIKKKMLK